MLVVWGLDASWLASAVAELLLPCGRGLSALKSVPGNCSMCHLEASSGSCGVGIQTAQGRRLAGIRRRGPRIHEMAGPNVKKTQFVLNVQFSALLRPTALQKIPRHSAPARASHWHIRPEPRFNTKHDSLISHDTEDAPSVAPCQLFRPRLLQVPATEPRVPVAAGYQQRTMECAFLTRVRAAVMLGTQARRMVSWHFISRRRPTLMLQA